MKLLTLILALGILCACAPVKHDAWILKKDEKLAIAECEKWTSSQGSEMLWCVVK